MDSPVTPGNRPSSPSPNSTQAASPRTPARREAALVVNEIYLSVQGESSYAGLPCIFIRLTGCNLRCSYCDSAYAFTQGQRLSLDTILDRVGSILQQFDSNPASLSRLPLVEITGGEPLLQPDVHLLFTALCDMNLTVLVETSGAVDIAPLDARVIRIMDLKCPSSGETERNRWENLSALRPRDEVKFVIGTMEDYDWAKRLVVKHDLPQRCTVLFSWVSPLDDKQKHPSLKAIPPGQHPISRLQLVERIIADRLPVRFQLQMHKFIWSPETRGV